MKSVVEKIKSENEEYKWSKMLTLSNIARLSGLSGSSAKRHFQKLLELDECEENSEADDRLLSEQIFAEPGVKVEVFEEDMDSWEALPESPIPDLVGKMETETDRPLTKNDFRYLATLAENFQRQGAESFREGAFRNNIF